MAENTKTTQVDQVKSMLETLVTKNATQAQVVDELKAWQTKLVDAGVEDVKAVKDAVKQLEDTTKSYEAQLAKVQKQLNEGTGGKAAETNGFKSLGEFAQAVRQAGVGNGVDERLTGKAQGMSQKAPTTFANEGTGADGGYVVPPTFAERIQELAFNDESLLAQTQSLPTVGNSLSIPVSETTPWGSSGVQANWVEEGGQAAQSKPDFKFRSMRLSKLVALVPISDELSEDASALESFVSTEAARAIRYKSDEAIMHGNGVAKPQGIFESPCRVDVAKETEQVSGTVVAENIVKMYARMLPSSLSNSRWKVSNEVLPSLMLMKVGDQPIWMPGGMLASAPNGLLLGRPIDVSLHCKAIGTLGDILFADMAQYLSLSKGMRFASSIHMFFDYGMNCFRFTFRQAGAPWLSDGITLPNSSNKVSPFVSLAERVG